MPTLMQCVSFVVRPSWLDKMGAGPISGDVIMTPSNIVPYRSINKTICFYAVYLQFQYCCNVMPCVNVAYGNHMACKNHCAIYQDLVDDVMQTYLEAPLWLGDNIGLLWWLDCNWVCTNTADGTSDLIVLLCADHDAQFLCC